MNTAAELVALETAMRDLARLYEQARQFTAVRPRAEAGLLPRLNALGRELRHELRGGAIAAPAVAAAATELRALTEQWRTAVEAVRESRAVADAVAAYQRDDQSALALLLPQIFAEIRPLPEPPPLLYLPVAVVVARRHGGNRRPIADAGEVAERIASLRDGIVAPASGEEWWETALPAIVLNDAPEAAETPVSLALDLASSSVAIFTQRDPGLLLVYTPRLTAPFEVVVANAAGDEWWAMSAEPYESFRDALREQLRQRQIAVRSIG